MVAGGKVLQRRLYNLLLDRTTFLGLVGFLALIVISGLQFGEAWLEWSADKYAAVFNSFSDNLIGRSLQVADDNITSTLLTQSPIFYYGCLLTPVNEPNHQLIPR